MGQYYQAYLKHCDTGKEKIFNTYIDGEYVGSKLMEHSWIGNHWVDSISCCLFKRKGQLAWVGDYAEASDFPKEHQDLITRVLSAWEDDEDADFPQDIPQIKHLRSVEINWNDKAFVNHTKKEYFLMYDYINNCTDGQNWCPHPVSLLTAIGNGAGGGDYYGENNKDIGCWALDIVEVLPDNEIPDGYTKRNFYFKE